jgi:hypothetical protein
MTAVCLRSRNRQSYERTLRASPDFVGPGTAILQISDFRAASTSHKVDLMPGATLGLRLSGAVFSDRSRTGDPIEATVTYPLCKNGENLACNEGELLVPPGTKVNGTILFAQKAPDKYSRPRLVLDSQISCIRIINVHRCMRA